MTALHQHQSRVSSPRRRLAGVVPPQPLLVAFQHGVDRVPIATRPSFPRKLALQSLLAHIHSQPFKHVCNYLSDGLHHFSQTVLSSVARLVGFDANENGLTYAKRSFASGAKEND